MPDRLPLSLYTVRDPMQSQTVLDAVQDYNPGYVVFDGKAPVDATAKAGNGVFTMTPVNRAGHPVPTFYNDWYFRIHLIPGRLDLGNLVSAQQRVFSAWNAFRTPQTLEAATLAGGEGIEITPPGALPLRFAPLQLREWQLSVGIDGPPTLNATWTFQFTGLAAKTVDITGVRVVPWTFAPDWAEGVLERLGWRTDVMASPTRREQRRGLRQSPTRRFELRSLLQGAERTGFDLAVYSWGGRTWAMPVWPDIVWLAAPVTVGASFVGCDTAHREFVDGGLALLRAGEAERTRSYEVVEIASVDAAGITLARPTLQAWPRGARLYPMRLAQMPQQPQLRRLSDTTVEARYQFEVVEPCDWPAIMPATLYRGAPVLEQAPEESETLTVDWERAQLTRDSATAFPRRLDTAATPATLQQHRWLLDGRVARSGYRSLLYALQGRFKSLWVPTFSADLTPVAPIAAAGAAIDIQAIDYPRFGDGRVGRRDIRIELFDGRVFHRRITGASTLDADTERVVIDSGLGVDLAPSQIHRISFMALCRQETDSAELRHATDAAGVAKSALVFRSIRDDV